MDMSGRCITVTDNHMSTVGVKKLLPGMRIRIVNLKQEKFNETEGTLIELDLEHDDHHLLDETTGVRKFRNLWKVRLDVNGRVAGLDEQNLTCNGVLQAFSRNLVVGTRVRLKGLQYSDVPEFQGYEGCVIGRDERRGVYKVRIDPTKKRTVQKQLDENGNA